MKEVCSNGAIDCDGVGSGSPVHKAELEKASTESSAKAQDPQQCARFRNHTDQRSVY